MIYPATYDIVVLQNSTFKMRLNASSSGSPINVSGYVFDADICHAAGGIIASFSSEVISAASGIVDFELVPSQTVNLEEGEYKYDLNATSPNGERYYWLKGALTVSGTCSRD